MHNLVGTKFSCMHIPTCLEQILACCDLANTDKHSARPSSCHDHNEICILCQNIHASLNMNSAFLIGLKPQHVRCSYKCLHSWRYGVAARSMTITRYTHLLWEGSWHSVQAQAEKTSLQKQLDLRGKETCFMFVGRLLANPRNPLIFASRRLGATVQFCNMIAEFAGASSATYDTAGNNHLFIHLLDGNVFCLTGIMMSACKNLSTHFWWLDFKSEWLKCRQVSLTTSTTTWLAWFCLLATQKCLAWSWHACGLRHWNMATSNLTNWAKGQNPRMQRKYLVMLALNIQLLQGMYCSIWVLSEHGFNDI